MKEENYNGKPILTPKPETFFGSLPLPMKDE
jgi:hypothetical protein